MSRSPIFLLDGKALDPMNTFGRNDDNLEDDQIEDDNNEDYVNMASLENDKSHFDFFEYDDRFVQEQENELNTTAVNNNGTITEESPIQMPVEFYNEVENFLNRPPPSILASSSKSQGRGTDKSKLTLNNNKKKSSGYAEQQQQQQSILSRKKLQQQQGGLAAGQMKEALLRGIDIYIHILKYTWYLRES